MHIPDGFLDPQLILITYLLSASYLFYTLRKIRKEHLSEEYYTLVPVLAAGIFAAQLINWPLPGGTSLHFVGGALAGILLGPVLGFLSMFLVLSVQCLLFHDGGITALGANILNMAIIDVVIGFYLYKLSTKLIHNDERGRIIGGFLGGWLGITLAGIACGMEIGFSPTFPYGVSITIPIMGGWHAILGLIEGVITAFVIDYIYRKSPKIITLQEKVSSL